MYEKLFSLKIPSGWAVIHNSFGDVEPIIQDGSIVNDEFFNEDLLSIEAIQFDGSYWQVDKNGYTLDLGWYPEANPDGFYRLTLIRGSWDHIVAKCESKDRYQIHRLVERCLELITQGSEDLEISRQIKFDQVTAA
ncbi:MAG: hypothetical protein F6K19_07350 [Cyanothece sp. SIO1E1]|nr:hypothetical protein [Cyanothece sp. SIO1E1]